MKNLYFDEENHRYYYMGERVPATSDVLKLVDAVALDGVPARTLFDAAERGSRVHEATEAYEFDEIDIDDEEWLSENADIAEYVNAYADFLEDYPAFPMASEEEVFCEKTGVAGRIDLVKEINGELALIDKKTSSTLGRLRNAIQLNIYRINWNETHERKIAALYILHLQKDGGYRLIPFEIDDDIALKWIDNYKEIKGDKKI